MGDFGARMLSKALQINNHLQTIHLDKNGLTAQGFEDIAEAMEKLVPYFFDDKPGG